MNSKQSTERCAIHITGTVADLKVVPTEKLKVPMATLTIKGERKTTPAIIFPQKYAEYTDLIKAGNRLHFSCELMDESLGDQQYQITAVRPLVKED